MTAKHRLEDRVSSVKVSTKAGQPHIVNKMDELLERGAS